MIRAIWCRRCREEISISPEENAWVDDSMKNDYFFKVRGQPEYIGAYFLSSRWNLKTNKMGILRVNGYFLVDFIDMHIAFLTVIPAIRFLAISIWPIADTDAFHHAKLFEALNWMNLVSSRSIEGT